MKLLPRLKKTNSKNKKHHYKLSYPFNKRKLAINEGIKSEINLGKTSKKAAIAKKGRLNILRIYRRYKNKKDCKKITSDMRYIDKKYNLGTTKNICNQKGGGKFKNCCNVKKSKKCVRKDGKIFNLPRKFSKQRCLKSIKGFSMRSSCAPYKYCKTKKQFLYNPENPDKSFDVYVNKNPKDTIPIKYKNLSDVKNTIKRLEKLYKTKKYPHKRIWQVGMILKVRLQTMNKYKKTKFKNAKNVFKRYILSKKYFNFLGNRSKKKTFEERKRLKFKL